MSEIPAGLDIHLTELGDVIWCDLDARNATPEALTSLLARFAPDVAADRALSSEMVADVLDPDLWPAVKHYDGTAIRGLSAVCTWVHEPDEHERGGAGRVDFEMVEMLVGEGWLLTCWHDACGFRGSKQVDTQPPRARTWLYREIQDAWERGGARSAGDAGLFVLREVIGHYANLRRRLHAWLEEWEVVFYEQAERAAEISEAPRFHVRTLIELRGLIAHALRCLDPINPPHDRAADFWFPGVTDRALAERDDEIVGRSLRNLRDLGDRVRSAFELLNTYSVAQQLRVAQMQGELAAEQAARAERTNLALGILATIFLWPTLVTGFFGMNTSVPWHDNSTGTIIALILMFGGIVAGFVLLWAYRRARRLVGGTHAGAGTSGPT